MTYYVCAFIFFLTDGQNVSCMHRIIRGHRHYCSSSSSGPERWFEVYSTRLRTSWRDELKRREGRRCTDLYVPRTYVNLSGGRYVDVCIIPGLNDPDHHFAGGWKSDNLHGGLAHVSRIGPVLHRFCAAPHSGRIYIRRRIRMIYVLLL